MILVNKSDDIYCSVFRISLMASSLAQITLSIYIERYRSRDANTWEARRCPRGPFRRGCWSLGETASPDQVARRSGGMRRRVGTNHDRSRCLGSNRVARVEEIPGSRDSAFSARWRSSSSWVNRSCWSGVQRSRARASLSWLLRQPNRPITPRPTPKSGKVAGGGAATGVVPCAGVRLVSDAGCAIAALRGPARSAAAFVRYAGFIGRSLASAIPAGGFKLPFQPVLISVYFTNASIVLEIYTFRYI